MMLLDDADILPVNGSLLGVDLLVTPLCAARCCAVRAVCEVVMCVGIGWWWRRVVNRDANDPSLSDLTASFGVLRNEHTRSHQSSLVRVCETPGLGA